MTCEHSGSRRPDILPGSDRQRLRAVYDAYDSDPRYREKWVDGAAVRFMRDRKWMAIGRLFERFRVAAQRVVVLALGAGGEGDCARFRECGIRPENIVAIDLLERQARRGRQAHPWMISLTGDAESLPFRDASFDVVYQSTMISSVLEARRRNAIFADVRRVLRHGGFFLSYDIRYPNPWNLQTRPLRSAELKRAFGGWHITIGSLTGIPQLLRVLAPHSIGVCRVLESIPPLRSHLLMVARRPPPPPGGPVGGLAPG
jgi:SAM-dependent methyltransferase